MIFICPFFMNRFPNLNLFIHMRHLFIVFITSILIFSGKVPAQITIVAQATAEIIDALSADETNQLHFGRFAIESNGGQIIISPEGNRTAQGAITLVSGPNGPGQFEITGFPEASFIIQLPDAPAILFHQGSGKTMQVDNWVSEPPAGNGPNTLANGSTLVSIGATLTVGSLDENPIGIYQGTFQLTFAYN